MNTLLKSLAIFVLVGAIGASCLHAIKAVVQYRNGNSVVVEQIGAETLNGVESRDQRTRAFIWEVATVRFTHQALDDFNSLEAKSNAGRGDQVVSIARDYISKALLPVPKDAKEEKEKGGLPVGTTEEERVWIRLTSKYYLARGLLLERKFTEAQAAFLDYMKDAETFAATLRAGVRGMPTQVIIRAGTVTFDSPTGGKIADAGLLHRLYLNALEGLGDAYAQDGKVDKANADAYDRLADFTTNLSRSASRLDFFDWAVRALRASASLNERNKNYDAAIGAHRRLENIARSKNSARDITEARLNVGYILIKAKRLNDATAIFRQPTQEWERSRRMSGAPMANWISPDKAYEIAGSYLGLGLIQSARARDNANSQTDDWAQALQHYCNALALFNAGDELRGSCLLYAAEATAKMGQVALRRKDVALAKRHAETAGSYLAELTVNLRATAAASDPDLADIRKIIEALNAAK